MTSYETFYFFTSRQDYGILDGMRFLSAHGLYVTRTANHGKVL